jgi:hypothetical protein
MLTVQESGVVAAGCDELRLGRGGSQRLVRGEETGAEKGALRAKHQRGGKAHISLYLCPQPSARQSSILEMPLIAINDRLVYK